MFRPNNTGFQLTWLLEDNVEYKQIQIKGIRSGKENNKLQ